MVSGILLYADGAIGNRLATQARKRAIGDGERCRRQSEEARLNGITIGKCISCFHFKSLNSAISFLGH